MDYLARLFIVHAKTYSGDKKKGVGFWRSKILLAHWIVPKFISYIFP